MKLVDEHACASFGTAQGMVNSEKRVLFISYPFPPVGGAGVQRTTKFVKYLGHHGWKTSVLTVANPSVPAKDKSLIVDIPEDTIVSRAPTLEPGYAIKAAVSATVDNGRRGWFGVLKGAVRTLGNSLLQPDAQVLWLPGAFRHGLRLLKEIPHDAIIATGPPFSSFILGAALATRTRLPLVLDYRDEWSISNAYLENRRPGVLARWIQERMQRYAVSRASALVATTQASAQELAGVNTHAGNRASLSCIYNGYDKEDIPAPPQAGFRTTYRLAYIGTLWNLTNVAPLVDGVLQLCALYPDRASALELVFVGRRTQDQDAQLDRLRGSVCKVIRKPYLPHKEVMQIMDKADGLAVLLSNLPGAGRVVPAKVFESMASQRTVLAIAPPGELCGLLSEYPASRIHHPSDVSGIAASLAAEIDRVQMGKPGIAASWDGSLYERRHQAGELAQLLDRLTVPSSVKECGS